MPTLQGVEKIAELREKQRNQFWPTVLPQKDIWRSNRKRPGFRTVPRTFPLILRLMDHAADEKVSGAYLDLWTQAYDEFIVRVQSEDDRAFYSGYGHTRTWRDRISRLEKLGFIMSAPYANRLYGFILILNPHKVLAWLHTHQHGLIDATLYTTLQSRAIETGIVDLKTGWDHPRDRTPVLPDEDVEKPELEEESVAEGLPPLAPTTPPVAPPPPPLPPPKVKWKLPKK